MMFTKKLMSVAIAASFAFAGTAFSMDRNEMKTEKSRVSGVYKDAKAHCDTLKDNAEDICKAEAKRDHKIAEAQLEVAEKDTAKRRFNARMAKVDGDYSVAKEKCDDLAGNAKDVCVKDAKAAHVTAKADAKEDKAVTNAVNTANEKVSDAHKDAKEDKRDANYAAAKERCDKFAGDVKDRCIADAKVHFGIK